MEKKNLIVPWISIYCLLLGMYTGFVTEFGYTSLDWKFLAGWTAIVSAAAVLLVLQLKPLISALLTTPALLLAGFYGYSQSEKLKAAVDVMQLFLNRQMAKYNGNVAVIEEASDTDAPDIVKTWANIGESLQDREMETLFLLCGFFVAVYISIVTMRLSFRIYGLILPYAVVLVGMSVGASPGILSVSFLFVGTALALYQVERSETGSLRQKGDGTGLHLKIPWALTVLCLCLALCMTTSVFLNRETQEDVLSHAADTLSWQHEKERQLKEFGNKLISTMKARFGVDNDGKLNNDTPEYTDKDVLRFTMDNKPTDDIYLRGFVGNSYNNGRWKSSEVDTALKDEMDELLLGEDYEKRLEKMRRRKEYDALEEIQEKRYTQRLYLMELDTVGLIRTAQKAEGGLTGINYGLIGVTENSTNLDEFYPKAHWKLEYIGAGKNSLCYYHPYFDRLTDTTSQSMNEAEVLYALLYGKANELQLDNTIRRFAFAHEIEGEFYPMSIQQAQERADAFGEWAQDENTDWSTLPYEDISLRSDVLEAYLSYARKKYTWVSEDLKRFRRFADNQGIYGDKATDIAIQIRASLWGRATYSKKLEPVPGTQDYVEYFLLEQKKGFCEHFATAGTLLFRYYGIPARFVSGYRIPVEAFQKNKDGTYTANVQDSYSHAWSEVLIGGLGWYPMEMTPGAAGVVRGQYDDESESTEQPTPTPTAVNTPSPKPTASAAASPKTAKNTASPSSKGGNVIKNATPAFWGILAAVSVLLACIAVCLCCRYSRGKYNRRLKKLKGQNSRTIRIMTEELMCFLTDCGLRGCEQMTEKEWIEQAFLMADIIGENAVNAESEGIAGKHVMNHAERADITGKNMASDVDTVAPTDANMADMDILRHIIEKAFFANEAVASQEYQEFLRICDTLTEKILQQVKGWYRFTIWLFGWRKQFAEWKKLCYDKGK